MIDASERHYSVQQVTKYFAYEHLNGEARYVSQACTELANDMLDSCVDSPELTAGLRKLLEAKDCFVRASLDL